MKRDNFKRYLSILLPLSLGAAVIFLPELGGCSDLASNLRGVQRGLLNTILPAIGTLGLIWGSISFISGNPAGRGHLIMGAVGLMIGFMAPSIVNFVQTMFPAGGV
jgi:hypothetical protein